MTFKMLRNLDYRVLSANYYQFYHTYVEGKILETLIITIIHGYANTHYYHAQSAKKLW